MLGVRPEDLHDEEVFMTTYPDTVLQSQVEVVEHMGSELYLHCSVGENTFIARVNPRHMYHVGSSVKLAVDLNKIHIFDAETEVSIGFAAPAKQEALV
ncbi:hypothetical protein GCM10025858_08310 [Alicyclobacillus sacchari]|nr:hypothetical protein GCM10025858_08310 [Alicyclobacillus sacchari]